VWNKSGNQAVPERVLNKGDLGQEKVFDAVFAGSLPVKILFQIAGLSMP